MAQTGMTNRECGALLGYTESGVSRLRNGGRAPSLELMLRVSGAFKWSMHAQVDAWLNGDWAEIFNNYVEGYIRNE